MDCAAASAIYIMIFDLDKAGNNKQEHVLIYIEKKQDASFMPINLVSEIYADKRSIKAFCFLGDKRSMENNLDKPNKQLFRY